MKNDPLLEKVKHLKLYGLLAHWEEVQGSHWIENMITWEEKERAHRSLERRLKHSRIGRFKPITEFDWAWPKKIDRETIEELLRLDFITTATNVILCGPNGVGKSTLAKNIAYQAAMQGFTVLFITAAQMLKELISQESDQALHRRIKYYVQPQALVIDEVGYLSYSNRHADLLFEIISQRYHDKSTLVTTNKPFTEWNGIFPNAACVVSMIDRLVHRSEIISIDAQSFRLKEATERALQRKKDREQQKSQKNIPNAEDTAS
jgi:DNA replication protein DnaC